jgi:phage baseplate assembly protein W
MSTFIGFSTQEAKFKFSTLEDVELAKRDLSNYFYTRRGERVCQPEFGSIIPELLFEQLSDDLADIIEDDIRLGIQIDPRWQLIEQQTIISDNTIECRLKIQYVPSATPQELYLMFKQEE